MNYRQKKKFFQNLNLTKLQTISTFVMFFQVNNINSLNRILLTKELNKVNLKLQIYQTKLLRRKKFIFEKDIAKNVYSGLFVILSTTSNDYLNNIHLFFKLSKDFKFLLPICVVYFKTLFFTMQLQKILNLIVLNQGVLFILLTQRFFFFSSIKTKIFAMKTQYHLIKQKTQIQLTDGSVFFLDIFSYTSVLKLGVDPKSHMLWRERSNFEINKNSINFFMKKFNFLIK